jgi:hypothetical protein
MTLETWLPAVPADSNRQCAYHFGHDTLVSPKKLSIGVRDVDWFPEVVTGWLADWVPNLQ